jgi:hypothetical protein
MLNIDYKIVSSYREFIENVKNLGDGQKYLKTVRNTVIGNYSLKDSRCIWMSLMIYKFKKDMDANDIIWDKSRSVILSVLRQDETLGKIIEDYLIYFNEWKSDDYQQFVTDIASFYYNILQIKNSIESNTQDQTTINEWKPHYDTLIENVRSSCSKIGCLNAIDGILITMERHKYNAVSQIMTLVYWDKIEKDIEGGNYEVIYRNLEELKTFLYEILPENEKRTSLDDVIDIDYIKKRVKNGVFDREYLLSLMTFIIDLLYEWDALHFRQRYTEEKRTFNSLENVSLPRLIRLVLEKCFFYTIDLKNRKGIWNKLLENPKK